MKELKNLILNYEFFYNQIYLIFCFVDGNPFNFFIKALNSFLFLSLIKKSQMVNSNLLNYYKNIYLVN